MLVHSKQSLTHQIFRNFLPIQTSRPNERTILLTGTFGVVVRVSQQRAKSNYLCRVFSWSERDFQVLDMLQVCECRSAASPDRTEAGNRERTKKLVGEESRRWRKRYARRLTDSSSIKRLKIHCLRFCSVLASISLLFYPVNYSYWWLPITYREPITPKCYLEPKCFPKYCTAWDWSWVVRVWVILLPSAQFVSCLFVIGKFIINQVKQDFFLLFTQPSTEHMSPKWVCALWRHRPGISLCFLICDGNLTLTMQKCV